MSRRVIPLLTIVVLLAGCNPFRIKPEEPVSRYQPLPVRQLPPFMRGTILELTDLADAEPLPVSGFGLVVNLENTGDNTQVPTPVREYILREMVKRGFGSKLVPGFERTSPEEVLRDPRTAIVRVDAAIPPGARPGDTLDVRVSAIPSSTTSSLARGVLYRTELSVGGADPRAPGVPIAKLVLAEGPIFIPPPHTLQTQPESAAARRVLRTGWVLDGGRVTEARPLSLRLRQPERRLARAVEARIDNRFAALKESQRDRVARALDEAIIRITIPPGFRGSWEHFARLVQHLYFDSSPEFIEAKARELAEIAVTPDAPLENISFLLEGLGPAALPHIVPLLTHERPEVCYAAARAAAYLGDAAASRVLAQMAAEPGHPFRLNAIRTLGYLPPSPWISGMIKKLLDSEDTAIRVAAYNMLASQKDPLILSRVVNERFILDVVPCGGSPLIYASTSGLPRIALIGPRPTVDPPFSFTAFDNRLTLLANAGERSARIFYRYGDGREPARSNSNLDLAEIIARLGGDEAARGQFDFHYGDVVAVLQAMSERQQIVARVGGKAVPAQFVLQNAPEAPAPGENRPLADSSRPPGEGAAVDVAGVPTDSAPPEETRPN
ncbi:MAG: flagellar basal body P-ring protein FlgI [Phycisphaerae bacterium]|nr:flagellar basal body P-ring protein FlgI [Phycisphaerae bacterium]MDW8261685.1 flagellar basal body P-ring protein FlgI [Phycisphaerales bacterium]